MGNPKFTIITVCYNAGQALPETVNRILKQTYGNYELLIKDAMSTDGSVEQLPSDPRIRLIRSRDSGIYDGMNMAIAEAKGDYLIFMNCGDWFYAPDSLQAVADAVDATHAPVYYGRAYYRKNGHVADYPRRITRMTCFRTMICHQAMVYAASLLKERGYDTSYRIKADRELLMYLVCVRKLQPVYVDAVIADYEGGGESSKKEHIRRNAADEKRLRNHYFSPWERLRYSFVMALTFPRLRRAISRSATLGRHYHRLTGWLYSRKRS